jgi:hypothetical protein
VADLGSFAVKSWKLFAGDFFQTARDVFGVPSVWLVRSPAEMKRERRLAYGAWRSLCDIASVSAATLRRGGDSGRCHATRRLLRN